MIRVNVLCSNNESEKHCSELFDGPGGQHGCLVGVVVDGAKQCEMVSTHCMACRYDVRILVGRHGLVDWWFMRSGRCRLITKVLVNGCCLVACRSGLVSDAVLHRNKYIDRPGLDRFGNDDQHGGNDFGHGYDPRKCHANCSNHPRHADDNDVCVHLDVRSNFDFLVRVSLDLAQGHRRTGNAAKLELVQPRRAIDSRGFPFWIGIDSGPLERGYDGIAR